MTVDIKPRSRVVTDGLEATAPGGPLDAPPLHYLARTRLAADTATPARALLARGTDPNGVWEGGWTVLAVAASRGDAPLVELLLDAGANPNDNESLYHSLEAPDAACTALLLERGAEPDLQRWRVETGDFLVLVSDGVGDAHLQAQRESLEAGEGWKEHHSTVTRRAIGEIIQVASSAEDAAARIRDFALGQMVDGRGKKDNVSVVVLRPS